MVNNFKKNFRDSLTNKQWQLIAIACGFLFVLALGSTVYYFHWIVSRKIDLTSNSLASQNSFGCEGCSRRLIDGVYVKPEQTNPQLISVMMDNEIAARPALGLAKANLVYEAEAEGGITRYLAIFTNSEDVTQIGPIRSARPYFLDWASEFSPIYVHCGGSPAALVKIIQSNLTDLNEFYNGQYFWRDADRIAPHNVVTSSQNLDNFISLNNLESKKFSPWQFKDDGNNSASSTDTDIYIKYAAPDYIVEWTYNSDQNNYLRHLANQIHRDASGEEISAKNVIIQVNQSEVVDDKLRLEVTTAGEGQATICLDGVCQAGKWRKDSQDGRTRYYKLNGEEFKFNAGTTWIEVINTPEMLVIN